MTDYFEFSLDDDKIKSISNLGLAHLGDAVYELMVRGMLCSQGGGTSHGLHRKTIQFVSAHAQARAMERIKPILTEEEMHVFKRGGNAHVKAVPSSATYSEYHIATGLEALFGYLYLKGSRDRLNQLFALAMEGEDYAS